MRQRCGWPLRLTRADGSLAFNALPATQLHHAGDVERLTTHCAQSSGDVHGPLKTSVYKWHTLQRGPAVPA